jgi:hypothetical protein
MVYKNVFFCIIDILKNKNHHLKVMAIQKKKENFRFPFFEPAEGLEPTTC